ncbi:hypothetical protein BDW74DRAFT_184261 [Aspergillus multicolor]|uniref:uncharacterized protein n=1 Tax=Aspergillus multicolor TaxID=41759 RepID=UPI003CCDF83A
MQGLKSSLLAVFLTLQLALAQRIVPASWNMLYEKNNGEGGYDYYPIQQQIEIIPTSYAALHSFNAVNQAKGRFGVQSPDALNVCTFGGDYSNPDALGPRFVSLLDVLQYR